MRSAYAAKEADREVEPGEELAAVGWDMKSLPNVTVRYRHRIGRCEGRHHVVPRRPQLSRSYLALLRVRPPVGVGNELGLGADLDHQLGNDFRTCTRGENRFPSMGLTTMPGGLPLGRWSHLRCQEPSADVRRSKLAATVPERRTERDGD